MATTKPTRPALRYHGGKWILAPWIISHFPKHRIYTEAYGGAASVLLRKPRAHGEIYNDLDGEVVNLFRVIRDPESCAELVRLCSATPFAREEFFLSYEEAEDPIERARRLVVRSYMGFGTDGATARAKTGFRSYSDRSGTTPARDWTNYPRNLLRIAERLRGIVIEHKPAVEVLATHDGAQTLHYVDPPYPHGTRYTTSGGSTGCRNYRHEMTDEDHKDLAALLLGLDGFVVLSGYDNEIYNDALPWPKFRKQAMAQGARERFECLWINPRAFAALNKDLFGRRA